MLQNDGMDGSLLQFEGPRNIMRLADFLPEHRREYDAVDGVSFSIHKGEPRAGRVSQARQIHLGRQMVWGWAPTVRHIHIRAGTVPYEKPE